MKACAIADDRELFCVEKEKGRENSGSGSNEDNGSNNGQPHKWIFPKKELDCKSVRASH